MKKSERKKTIEKLDRMNKIKVMKKKTLTPKQLKKKYEHIIRDLVIQRDGGKCQVLGFYVHACEGRLVADHRPIPRGKGNIAFFDPRNLSTVCNKINGMAQNWPVVNHAICQVVIEREGKEAFQELQELAKRKPFKVTEEYVLGIISSLKQRLGVSVRI